MIFDDTSRAGLFENLRGIVFISKDDLNIAESNKWDLGDSSTFGCCEIRWCLRDRKETWMRFFGSG